MSKNAPCTSGEQSIFFLLLFSISFISEKYSKELDNFPIFDPGNILSRSRLLPGIFPPPQKFYTKGRHIKYKGLCKLYSLTTIVQQRGIVSHIFTSF